MQLRQEPRGTPEWKYRVVDRRQRCNVYNGIERGAPPGRQSGGGRKNRGEIK